MREKIEPEAIITAYEKGESLRAIANTFGTYPTTIRRILQRNNISLRHDSVAKGQIIIENGEELIEWAKAQGRLVTKAELANVLGKVRLSPSYFLKYPELGKYVVSYEQQDLTEYTEKLFNWLRNNNILYKPNDKTALEGTSVHALLLGEYKNILIMLDIKSKVLSKKQYEASVQRRNKKAKEKGFKILYLTKEHFNNLDCVKEILEKIKE